MQKLLMLFLLAWAVAFFGSFVAFLLTPGRDFGLSAGWNKISVFMGWQLVAVVLALVCMVMRWSTSDPRLKRLAAIPAVAVGLLMSVAAVVLFWGNIQQAPPYDAQPPGPVTAPATEG
jgi:hypothetical protein